MKRDIIMSNGLRFISTATQRNWERLNAKSSGRLTHRANKTCSQKQVVPDDYISNDGLDTIARQLVSCTSSIADIFYYLCIQKLCILNDNINVEKFVSEYERDTDIDIVVPEALLLDTTRDWLGYLYQLCIPEGQRNIRGQYYTNAVIVGKMLSDVALEHDKSFFDPCCGTGAFLMNAHAKSLSQLYGTDIDEIAVMIAKANLIALFPNDITYPHIYCEDYLEDSLFSPGILSTKRFEYIYTNPPWGICKTHQYTSDVIHSGERSSMFFVKAFRQLAMGGRMGFLLPSSLLKVKVHQDFRSFVMTKTKIDGITMFKERFNGVFTDFFSISVSRQHSIPVQSYCVRNGGATAIVTKKVMDSETEIELNASDELEILAAMEARGVDNLSHSTWALGIVTGDNKGKLMDTQEAGTEAIYTGKDICRYTLKPPCKYIRYDRSQLQQCAKEEYYRCPEKLVYKFISKTLCFAYDNSSALFLNSANILVPQVRGMSIKTVLAFLNSELFSYYYMKKFTDIKVLKSNLMTLPFPGITTQQDAEISLLVSRVLNGEDLVMDKIEDYIYALYGLPASMVNKIKRELYGNTNRSA